MIYHRVFLPMFCRSIIRLMITAGFILALCMIYPVHARFWGETIDDTASLQEIFPQGAGSFNDAANFFQAPVQFLLSHGDNIEMTGRRENRMKQVTTRKIAQLTKETKTTQLRISTSRSIVTPGGKIYLAADVYTETGECLDVYPHWSIQPKVTGVHIDSHGILTVNRNVVVKSDEKIRITASQDGITGEKEILLTRRDPLLLKTKVHYFRYDGNYSGWNVWGWNHGSDSKQIDFTEKTDLGMLAGVDRDLFIIRYSDGANLWALKETGDVSVKGRNEIFIVEGDYRIFTNFRDAVTAARPRIIQAVMDSKNTVQAYLTSIPMEGTVFTLLKNNRQMDNAVTFGKKLVFNIGAGEKFDPSALYEIRASKGFPPRRVIKRSVLDTFYYDGDDMGVVYSKERIGFRVWAPGAASVSLMIYDDHKVPKEHGKETPMKRDDSSGTWHVSVPRKGNYGKFYLYRVVFYPNTSCEKINYAVDPYAYAVSVNGNRGAIIDITKDPETMFENWKPDSKPSLKALEDSILYELHVRDLSIDVNSGIKPEYRGKYLAFTQSGTTHPKYKSIKTGIDHISELGVTHVHLLPVYDYATVDEEKLHVPQFNWGYDPKNYNVPEGSYSTDPFDPKARIREFRKMVQAMHDRDIRVIMDVVYNHTYTTDVFDPLVPYYYYRTDNYVRYTNGSGCGNEVASERPMVRKYIVDSVRHWLKNYNIDGFRFDLMGLIDVETVHTIVTELRAMDPTVLIYGEPWCGGTSALPGDMQVWKGKQRGQNYSVFNDNFRNVLRGNNDVPHPSRGFVTGETTLRDKVLRGVTGSIHDFTHIPGETINYVAAHDNYTLWDQVVAASGHKFPYPYIPRRQDGVNSESVMSDQRVRRTLLANGIILTSQGIPFIHAGDELLRTKYGDHNSYRSSDDINMIRWDWKRDYLPVFNYYQGLVKLRREHPAFRLRTREQIEKHFETLPAPGNMVAFALKNHANGDRWRNILVVYNPHVEPLTLCLPPGKWKVVVNDRHAGTEPVKTGMKAAEGCIGVPALSMMVMYDYDRGPTE